MKVAYLKSISGHTKTLANARYYLERGKRGEENPHRVLGMDFCNIEFQKQKDNWDSYMDSTRKGCDTNRDWNGRKATTYRHFIISPDPQDKIDLETLRALTMDWAVRKFGDSDKAGELGSYQAAIVYHDDNALRIPHAHVIVNNVNLDNCRRLQLTNADCVALSADLQTIARRYGLHHLDYVRGTGNEVVSISKVAEELREEALRGTRRDHRPSAYAALG